MVRLRKQTGEVIQVDAKCAIELLDASGNLGLVVLQQPGGSIHILTPGDPLFNAHLVVTQQKASRVVVHEPAPPIRNGKPFDLVSR